MNSSSCFVDKLLTVSAIALFRFIVCASFLILQFTSIDLAKYVYRKIIYKFHLQNKNK